MTAAQVISGVAPAMPSKKTAQQTEVRRRLRGELVQAALIRAGRDQKTMWMDVTDRDREMLKVLEAEVMAAEDLSFEAQEQMLSKAVEALKSQ